MVLPRTCAVGFAAILVFSGASFAQQNAPQQKPQPRKLSDAEKKEIQVVVKITDDIVAGQPAPNDLSLTWLREDILKALGNKEYVPFSVSIDPTKVSTPNLALYWRVVSKDASAAAAPPASGKKDEKKKEGKPDYPWEELGSVTIPPGQKDPIRISRSFMVGPGNYDLIVVAKEPVPEKAPKNPPPQKTSAIKQSITVPDLWNDQLATSSVIVAERIDDINEPLTPKQQSERPYAMGSMEIIPATSTKFKKTAELQTFVLIYNAKTHPDGKPDVLVEYNFYAKQAGAEKFFNKTNPQNLNAQTLPPQFDLASGYQLQSGQAVPLASFPEGEYRLEIKITDKVSNNSLTRDVNFSVSGS